MPAPAAARQVSSFNMQRSSSCFSSDTGTSAVGVVATWPAIVIHVCVTDGRYGTVTFPYAGCAGRSDAGSMIWTNEPALAG